MFVGWKMLVFVQVFVSTMTLLMKTPDAASITFTPLGAQLDADPIKDIETSPGQILNLSTTISTAGLAGPLVSFNYTINFDPNELTWISERRGELDKTEFIFVDAPNHATGFTHQRIHGQDGFGANQSLLLDLFTFQALSGLTNDGVRDFWLDVTSAIIVVGDVRVDATASFTDGQDVEVQPARPVSAPPTILLFAAAAIGLLGPRRAGRCRLLRMRAP